MKAFLQLWACCIQGEVEALTTSSLSLSNPRSPRSFELHVLRRWRHPSSLSPRDPRSRSFSSRFACGAEREFCFGDERQAQRYSDGDERRLRGGSLRVFETLNAGNEENGSGCPLSIPSETDSGSKNAFGVEFLGPHG